MQLNGTLRPSVSSAVSLEDGGNGKASCSRVLPTPTSIIDAPRAGVPSSLVGIWQAASVHVRHVAVTERRRTRTRHCS